MEASAKRIAVHTTTFVPAANRPHEEVHEERPNGSPGCDSQRWLDVVDEIQRSEEAFRDGLAVIEEVRARGDVLAYHRYSANRFDLPTLQTKCLVWSTASRA
jgi:hypothetical protein